MGYVLMQPDNTAAECDLLSFWSDQAAAQFDTSIMGPHLRPILFGSRRCTPKEQHFHSFVGEAACGRWAIGQLRKYIWGTHFYWIMDCIALREFINYDGPIHQVRRWTQELLGYYFTVLHRPSKMMRDVDALSRMYDPLIQHYNATAASQLSADQLARPLAYCPQSIDDLTRSFAPSELDQSTSLQPTSPTCTVATLTTFTNLPPRFHSPSLQPSLATTTLNLTNLRWMLPLISLQLLMPLHGYLLTVASPASPPN